MAFLGSKSCHETCSARIQAYLERDGRALSHDFINIYSPDRQRAWASFMDRTRVAAGNDSAWGGKESVTYQHFVISPDPRDEVSLDQLRELALEWAGALFGDGEGPGALGTYQVALIAHDDNRNKIPHMHVVVNNTDLETGRRLHLGRKENEGLLPDTLQDMAEARGLRHFDNSLPRGGAVQEAGRYFTKTERSLLRSGRYCWKQDLCNNIQVARRTSTSESELLDQLERLGVSVEERGGDWLFRHPGNPERWSCSGYRLGRNYTKEGLAAALAADALDSKPRSPRLRDNVAGAVLSDFFADMELVAVVAHGKTVADVASALSAIDRHQIRSESDFDASIKSARARLARAKSNNISTEAFERDLAQVCAAKETALSGTFFKGVELPAPPAHSRPSDSDGSGSGSAKGGGRKRRKPKERWDGRGSLTGLDVPASGRSRGGEPKGRQDAKGRSR